LAYKHSDRVLFALGAVIHTNTSKLFSSLIQAAKAAVSALLEPCEKDTLI